VVYDGHPDVIEAVEAHRDYTASATLSLSLEIGDPGAAALVSQIDELPFRFRIDKAG